MMGAGVEGIMRMRDRLKLTDDQFQRLDAVRSEVVQRRIQHQARAEELRSRVMAGEATRGTLVDSMTAWRKAGAEIRQQDRQRVESILSDAQKDTLQTLMQRRRAFAAGRASAFRGMRQHMRMGRDGFRSGRSPGFRGARGWGDRGGMMRGRMGGRGFGPPPVLPDSSSAGGSS